MTRETLTQIFLTGFTDGSFELSVADRHGYNTLSRRKVDEDGARELAAVADDLLGNRHASQVVGQTIREREQRLSDLRKQADRISEEIRRLVDG